jgi:hypothetical protein
MATPLHTFTNEPDGMQSYVWNAEKGGYNVTMKDLDSGEFIPAAVHTVDLDKAVDMAKKWAGVA